MKILAVECPKCHANINIEDGRKEFYCSYCGAQLFFDDGTTISVIRDEAEIKKAEVKLAKVEYEKEVHERKSLIELIKVLLISAAVMYAFNILWKMWNSLNPEDTAPLIAFLILIGAPGIVIVGIIRAITRKK